ncbi:hypothetical protein IOMTU433_p177 (plasmid) [Acinetobacter baumannii]|nr:hypothetical protein IOMTU433_p177 [Acinetobacter baumannii]
MSLKLSKLDTSASTPYLQMPTLNALYGAAITKKFLILAVIKIFTANPDTVLL